MYKKFVLNMIETAIYREFNYTIKIENLTILDISDNETMYFSFETIFENVTITGFVRSLDGECIFVKNADYETVKAFYK